MNPPKPFRFGVNCTTTSAREWLESARKAEALGFSTFIAQDHFANQLAPLPALAAAAGVTTTIRLATLVLDNDFRHPAVLAKEVATLDLLSQGRIELGLGAGWLEADYTQTGMTFDPPAQRIARLRESVHVIKALLSSQAPVSFTGKHYTIQALEPLPKAVQQPRPPLMLGGRQKNMLALAAREADIVSISLLGKTRATFEQKVAWVREAAGLRLADIEIQVNISRVDLSATSAEETPNALTGSVEQIAETLLRRRQESGVSYYVIKAASMEAFAPVIARLP